MRHLQSFERLSSINCPVGGLQMLLMRIRRVYKENHPLNVDLKSCQWYNNCLVKTKFIIPVWGVSIQTRVNSWGMYCWKTARKNQMPGFNLAWVWQHRFISLPYICLRKDDLYETAKKRSPRLIHISWYDSIKTTVHFHQRQYFKITHIKVPSVYWSHKVIPVTWLFW